MFRALGEVRQNQIAPFGMGTALDPLPQPSGFEDFPSVDLLVAPDVSNLLA
jgi:hypothetical protein